MSEPQHLQLIKTYADRIIMMTTLQLKQLHTKHLVEISNNQPRDQVFKLHSMCRAILLEVCVVQNWVEIYKIYTHPWLLAHQTLAFDSFFCKERWVVLFNANCGIYLFGGQRIL